MLSRCWKCFSSKLLQARKCAASTTCSQYWSASMNEKNCNFPNSGRNASHSLSLGLKQPKQGLDNDVFQSFFLDINSKNTKSLKKEYEDLVSEAYQGGGEKGIQRHVQRNKKILVRERIEKLLDANSPFVEIGTIAGHGMEYGSIPCAGAVMGIGKVHGIWCMIFANDATVKSGSIYPITIKKQLRGQIIAEENFLPTIYLVDSAGAFLPLQAEIFNIGGKTFYNEAIMSSQGIPQIAMVCGSCTAGGAYVPTMAEEAIIVDKIGTIFLGGPPLVRAATGEEVTPEQLGGATLHCSISGCTDHFVATESEGFEVVRNIVATSNFQGIDTKPQENDKVTELNQFAAAAVEYPTSAYNIIKLLADNGGFHEYKQKYGSTLVTGFMFVKDNIIGVVANNGYLGETAANKGSNFVQLCGTRQIPVLFLQNFTHDETDQSQVLQTGGAIKTRAKLMQSIVMCKSPKMVISVGGLVGSPHMHPMCSLSMGARFHFVWPNVKIGANFLQNMEKSMKYEEYLKLKRASTSFYGASRLLYDGIVMPEDTRTLIYLCLNIFKQESAARHNQSIKNELTNEMHTVFRM